jgi:hypothetical protein
MGFSDPFNDLFLVNSAGRESDETARIEGSAMIKLAESEQLSIDAGFPSVSPGLRYVAARLRANAILSALEMDEIGFSWDSIDRTGHDIAHVLALKNSNALAPLVEASIVEISESKDYLHFSARAELVDPHWSSLEENQLKATDEQLGNSGPQANA